MNAGIISATAVASTVTLCITLPAQADHPAVAFGAEASGPVITIPATPMPRGAWALGLRNEFVDRDAFDDTELTGFAARGAEGVHSVATVNSASAALAWGVTDTLTLSLRVPWVAREDIREGELDHGSAEAHGHGDASGLGDLVFLGSHRVARAAGWDLALQLGFKAPTGETGETDQGARLESELQPGAGAWDLLAGVAASRAAGRWALHTNVLLDHTTEGAQDTEIGDALFFNAAVVYTLAGAEAHAHASSAAHAHWRVDAMLELNGERRWKDAVLGIDEPHSGGTLIYVSPGMRVSLGPAAAFVSAGIPVLDDPHGVQTEVSWRLIGGFGFAF